MTTHTSPVSEAYLPPCDDGDFFAELLERSKDALAADTAALLLLDQASAYLNATAADGLEDEVRQGVRVTVGKGFAGLDSAVPAGPRNSVRSAWCPHGHSYSPGSFTVIWERCPCRPRPEARRGHYLIACRRCAAELRQTEINIPKCRCLDF